MGRQTVGEPDLAVVIPTFRRADSLRRTLAALAACTPPPGGFEVVVVDDGSNDSTAEVVDEADGPIRYVWQPNAGPAAARNRGWRATTAPIVVFTDDDTVPTTDWLTELHAAMCAAPEVGGLGGRIVPLRSGFVADFVQAERLVSHGVDDSGVRYLVTANAAFLRHALETVGGFDESFPGAAGEDVDLSYRVAAAGWRLAVTSGAVVAHDHPSSLRAVMKTLRRHGAARNQLADRHASAGTARAAMGVIAPRAWVQRFNRYRADGYGVARSAAFIVVHGVGLANYLIGAVKGRRSITGEARPRSTSGA